MEKILNKIIISGIILLLISIVVMNSPWGEKKRVQGIKESLLDEEFIGIVIKVFMDKENHNRPTILVEESGHIRTFELTFITNSSEIMKEVSISDSIIKRKGKLELEVIHKDSISLSIPLIPISPKY